MDFLQNTVKLSVYDVVRFPAYFSYPLEKVIEPRVVFLEVRERAGAPE
jgi:mTERF.